MGPLNHQSLHQNWYPFRKLENEIAQKEKEKIKERSDPEANKVRGLLGPDLMFCS